MKKTCSKCKIEKEITEFKLTYGKCYRRACKPCWARQQSDTAKRRREEAKANHLYKVECPGGYYYIGSTTRSIEERRKTHSSENRTTLSKHIKENSLSKEDLKYSVVKEFQDPEEMRIAERDLIRSSYTDPFLLNEIIPLRGTLDMEKNPKRFCSKCKIEKPVEEFIEISPGQVSSSCKQCRNTMSREYREANKEKIAKQKKEYREANKEKIAKRNKARYEANKEKKLLDNQ